jgi:hypothetical protein
MSASQPSPSVFMLQSIIHSLHHLPDTKAGLETMIQSLNSGTPATPEQDATIQKGAIAFNLHHRQAHPPQPPPVITDPAPAPTMAPEPVNLQPPIADEPHHPPGKPVTPTP